MKENIIIGAALVIGIIFFSWLAAVIDPVIGG